MNYRAIISLDWGAPHNGPAQQHLIVALVQSGWLLAETTALTIETADLNAIWRGIGLVARAASNAGTLTSLNFNIVASDDFSRSRAYKAERNYKDAAATLMKRPFPG